MAENLGKLAVRYAKALQTAVDRELGSQGSPSPAQQLAASLLDFVDVWENQPEFSATITNPMFDESERLQALIRIAQDSGLPEIAQRFLKLVFDRDRIAALPEIANTFAQFADRAAGVVQVEVTVAEQLPDTERGSIETRLDSQITGSLIFDWRTDPALIGGMVVRYQGKVLDGSLRGRLERIERQLRGH